jgi:hypothetical protein
MNNSFEDYVYDSQYLQDLNPESIGDPDNVDEVLGNSLQVY